VVPGYRADPASFYKENGHSGEENADEEDPDDSPH